MIAIRMMALGRKIGNLYAGLCAPICRQYGMNQTCFDVLMFCANNPDRNTARDVCEVRGIKSGMASVAVETLEKSGLLERREDPEDRRKHRLMPTERAAGVIAEGRAMQAYFTDTLRQGITAEEFAALESLMSKLERTMEGMEKEGRLCC